MNNNKKSNDAEKFEKLLLERNKLDKLNSNKKEKVTANDSQLKDTIKNFNESNLYYKK